jgi:hypothetical protein
MNRNTRAVIAALSVVLILAAACLACDAAQYELVFINNSSNSGDACVYQYDPDMDAYDVMSLAWFSKGTAPTTTLRFYWTIDYSFVWDEVGELSPGVVFQASQMWPADPTGDNCITLTYLDDPNAYTFKDLGPCGEIGNLYIHGDRSVPVKDAAVGIGMSGAPYVVRPAQSNWQWVYTPKPMYWITLGTFEAGEILDIESISTKQAIHFDRGIYSMTVTLNHDNTWTVEETSND